MESSLAVAVDSEFKSFLKPVPKENDARSKKDQPNWRETLPQILASLIAYGIVLQAGANMAYSTVLIGDLESTKDILRINGTESSWIASLVTISTPVGSLVAGPLMDAFGRKTICMATCCPIIISWLLLAFTTSLPMIYSARIIAGLAGGLTTVSLVYVMEITHPSVRGMLLCCNSVAVALGILLTCLWALFWSWREIAVAFIVLNTIVFLALSIIPESPHWLVYFRRSEKRAARADNNLRWLNPNPTIYLQECLRIQAINSNPSGSNQLNGWKLLLTPEIYRPFRLLFLIFLVQQLSGCYVVVFYAISVFRTVSGKFNVGINEYGSLVFLGVVRFVMSVVAAFLSRNVGRRVLCIVSGIGMSFSMLLTSIYLYLPVLCNEDNVLLAVLEDSNWILIVLVLLYVCMSSLGFVVIPWTLISELLPISFRGIGGGLTISVAYAMMFGVVKGYPYAVQSLGARNVFLFFGVISIAATAVVYFFLPETLGKTSTEIERHFVSPKSKSNST